MSASASAFAVELDLTDVNPEDLERGQIGAGYHHVSIDDVSQDDRGAFVLDFVVQSGPFKGFKFKDWLHHPANATDDEKAKGCRNRMAVVASRLGLIGDADFGKKVAPDFMDLLGKECYVHVEAKTKKDDKGNQKTYTNVVFAGYYALDDARVPAEFRTHPGTDKTLVPPKAGAKAGTAAKSATATSGAANGAGKPAAAASAKDQFANL